MNIYITQNSFYFVHRHFHDILSKKNTKVIYVIEDKGIFKKMVEIIKFFGARNFLKILIGEIFYFLFYVKKIIAVDSIKIHESILNLKLEEIMNNNRVNRVISIGCPTKIDTKLQSKFKTKILNLHGGILPFQKGRFSPIKSIKKGHLIIGATIHELSEEFDSGKIITQSYFKVENKDFLFNYSKVIKISRKLLNEYLNNKISKIPENYLNRQFMK
tara:strand:- start:260 stop:907 length:648 start_codon:yes stop_codon:yes gene_type:complete